MPTHPYAESAKPLPEAIELREAAAAHGYRLVPIGETMPKGEGRPTLTFDGAGYHCARCGSSQIALCEHWQALFERAHAAILLGQPTTALGKLRELVALANKWETLSKGYARPEPLRDATWQACADELRVIITAATALQSVPSSPPLAPNKPGSGVLSPETIEKAVEIADKFFAGAGAPSDAGQPERERFLAVHEITCELESLAEGKGYPCPELHVSRPLGKALVAYTEKIQRDASNAALEKLRERIQSEVLTLFAPAPRPAEKG